MGRWKSRPAKQVLLDDQDLDPTSSRCQNTKCSRRATKIADIDDSAGRVHQVPLCNNCVNLLLSRRRYATRDRKDQDGQAEPPK